jgi:methylmalonyl-CoA/ethylmalonyl-CoA epimerase
MTSPQIKVRLDHIGIAVQQLPELQQLFALLGISSGPVESVPDQGVDVHFFNLAGNAPHLELLSVQDPEGAIAKFISKRGPGIHHLSFEVESGGLDSLSDTLRAAGYRMIYNEARSGAQGMRINFIHPQSCSGVLIELMERLT